MQEPTVCPISISKAVSDTKQQLQIIQTVGAIFSDQNIPYWLRGGWALDFLLGRVTRPHSDIDLICWSDDKDQIIKLLTENRFSLGRDLGIQVDFHWAKHEISVVFISLDEQENVYVKGIPTWRWLPDALTHPPQTLNGLTCPVLSPAQLLEEKEGYEQGTGRPLRPKDHQSIHLLKTCLTH